MPNQYISKITIPQGTFYIKDSEARDLIAAISGQIQFNLSTNAATTPKGVTWDNSGTLVTGTLVPATNTGTAQSPVWTPTVGYYLVPQTNANGQDYYSEYVVVYKGSASATQYGGYDWEKIGDTEIDLSSLGALAYKDSVTLNKQTATVVGSGTQIVVGGVPALQGDDYSTDIFVKSYPGSTQKLETTSITGTNGTVSVSQVTKSNVTATNTVFGTSTTASSVTKIGKTASNTVFGTSTTASKATAGTAVSVAKAASSATNVSRIALSSGNTSILEKATVDTSTETLTIGAATVTQSSVTGTNGTQSITPYTFADVTVPVVSSNDAVNFDAVASITDVTVPVVSSNTSVTANTVAITNVNAAVAASTATVVATGQTTSSDANGDSVLVGLGTATTGQALTKEASVSVPEQTITITGNTTVLTDDTSVTVS